jgi:beta-phosphoglucomutase
MHTHKAVIFDVDGVLVDSYEAHLRSWQIVAREDGVPFSVDDFVATFGRTSREIIERFWHMTDPRAVRDLDDRKEALYREIVAEQFPAMDGAVELIDALHAAGFALAMGSSGPPENVQLAMDRLGRHEAFAAAVSGYDVPHGKPDPAIFLAAAMRLGVPAQRCVVIEDAPPGVQAAQAAGMACAVLLSRGRERAHFAHLRPDLIVTSLRELSPPQLAGLIQRDQPGSSG